jgi:hypothetical protein
MNVIRHLDDLQIARVGPSLRERLHRWIVAVHHRGIVTRLRHFRQQLETDMAPEPWTTLKAPMMLLLADVCEALALSDDERAKVFGQQGEQALAGFLESRPVFPLQNPLNGRQNKALTHVRDHGRISLSEYRELCPGLSDETLRRDLVGLAKRDLLAKNGHNRGTYYTMAA